MKPLEPELPPPEQGKLRLAMLPLLGQPKAAGWQPRPTQAALSPQEALEQVLLVAPRSADFLVRMLLRLGLLAPEAMLPLAQKAVEAVLVVV